MFISRCCYAVYDLRRQAPTTTTTRIPDPITYLLSAGCPTSFFYPHLHTPTPYSILGFRPAPQTPDLHTSNLPHLVDFVTGISVNLRGPPLAKRYCILLIAHDYTINIIVTIDNVSGAHARKEQIINSTRFELTTHSLMVIYGMYPLSHSVRIHELALHY